jgi:type I restriction enzyme, S subunit
MELVSTKIKFQKFQSVKDSEISWLGEIPEQWDIRSLKNILTERNEKNDPIKTKERLSLSIDKGITLYAEKTTNLDRFKDDFSQYKLAYTGDLVFNSMNMIVGAVGVSNYFGCVSPVYYTYYNARHNSSCTKFYEYLFKSKTLKGVLFSLGKGLIAKDRGDGKYNTLRLKVGRDDLRSLKLPYPSLNEQTSIVNFLDEKTAKIDKAITQKEKMIDLLRERKQIIIQNAVTKGLDPNVKLKNSGVTWIGEIPEHWEVKRLKYLLKEPLKYGANESGIEYHPDLPRYVRITDFSGDGKLSEDKKLSLPHGIGINYLLKDGDILFARSGATVGKSYQFRKSFSDEKYFCFAGYLIKASPNESIMLSDYLNNYTSSGSFEKWKNLIFNKATIENIGADKYSQLRIPCPSISEQSAINDYITAKSTKIDIAIEMEQNQIKNLKEYKVTLIDIAVTGKIKVC